MYVGERKGNEDQMVSSDSLERGSTLTVELNKRISSGFSFIIELDPASISSYSRYISSQAKRNG